MVVHRIEDDQQMEDPAVPVEPQWENAIPEDLVDHPLLLAMQESESPFLVTNPRLPGNPIVYVNNGFLDMTGFSEDRVTGRNCRFMQGPATDPVVVAKMRDAIDEGRDITVTLLNYRADGSTFYNHIIISTIKDPDTDEVLYFVGLTEEVAAPPTTSETDTAITDLDDQENMNS
eukprot:scaffold22569_cov116-Cylindrotheca_fusiformis.AAC.2